MLSVTNTQKLKIKEMVNELIVNHGMLNKQGPYHSVDGMNIQELTRLAFKYYRMIIKGESPLDVDLQPEQSEGSEHSISAKDILNCIGCNQPLTERELSEKMPVCEICRKKVKVDFDILREILH